MGICISSSRRFLRYEDDKESSNVFKVSDCDQTLKQSTRVTHLGLDQDSLVLYGIGFGVDKAKSDLCIDTISRP